VVVVWDIGSELRLKEGMGGKFKSGSDIGVI
jgi:hypothetical protein